MKRLLHFALPGVGVALALLLWWATSRAVPILALAARPRNPLPAITLSLTVASAEKPAGRAIRP